MSDGGPPLHDDVEALAPLLGTWRGAGRGSYPTIDDFTYTDEVVFGHVGKPFLTFLQRTRHGDTGLPLHTESGYLRGVGGDAVELVIALPSGIAEIHTGTHHHGRITLASHAMAATPTAKDVTAVTRVMVADGDTLTYEVAMAAMGHGLTHHLAAELRRVEP